MRTIDVDDDVFLALEVVSAFNKTPLPQVVRQIVMERIHPKPASTDTMLPHQSSGLVRQSPRDKALREYSQSPSFLANRSVVDQFLDLFSFLYKENAEDFKILEAMEGRRRKYIAKSEQELDDSGKSVNAKRIPNTNYWVVTNNSTENKKVLLQQALTLLGYGHDTARFVPSCLR